MLDRKRSNLPGSADTTGCLPDLAETPDCLPDLAETPDCLLDSADTTGYFPNSAEPQCVPKIWQTTSQKNFADTTQKWGG